MLYLHPAIMPFVILFLLYVLRLGLDRTFSRFPGRRRTFRWGSHVRYGRYAVLTLLAGAVGGALIALWRWEEVGNTGLHYMLALVMLPMMVIAYGTGHIMDAYRRKRTLLPLVHMINNLLLCALAVAQVITGIAALQEWVL